MSEGWKAEIPLDAMITAQERLKYALLQAAATIKHTGITFQTAVDMAEKMLKELEKRGY
jgi:hypothetical protein